MKNYEYEEDLDILYVYNNPDKEKAEDSLVLGNIVIDIAKNGRVLGVEIDCASKLFNFPSEQLNNLSKAIIQVMRIGNMLTLGIAIATPVKEHSFQFAIQQETSQKSRIPISAC